MSRYSKLLEQVKKEHKEYESDSLNDRVLIIDALNTYIRCFAAVPTMNEDGDHVGGISGFLKSVGLTIRTFRPTRCIIVFDGRGGSKRRRKLYPDYKENRRHMVRLNRTYDFKDKEDEDRAMRWQLLALAHILTCLPVTVLAPPNVEADDVIAYTANLIQERGGKAIIMSTDKDFLQLISDHIDVWNPIKKKLYHTEQVLEEYGIHPHNFAIYRALDGDKSDNIPGVKGVGLKTLIKNYPQLSDSEFVDVNGVLDYANGQSKGKMFENIAKNRDIIERNYKLVRLDEVQMSSSTKMDVVDKIDKTKIVFNKTEMTKQLANLAMLGSFGNYDQWLIRTWQPLIRFSLQE